MRGIYDFKSPSGKIYVGQSDNIKRRIEDHFRDTIKKKTKFGDALKKYSRDEWKINIKEMPNATDEELDMYEIMLIKHYNSFHNGYNGTEGGGGTRGHRFKWTEEQKINCERPKGENHHNFGKITPDETRQKQADAVKGDKNPMYGISLKDIMTTENYEVMINKRREALKKPKLSTENYKVPQEIVTCPHCGKSGGNRTMPRWHFNNCKNLTFSKEKT